MGHIVAELNEYSAGNQASIPSVNNDLKEVAPFGESSREMLLRMFIFPFVQRGFVIT